MLLSEQLSLLKGPTETTESPTELVIVTPIFAAMSMLQGRARHSRCYRGLEIAAIRRDRRPFRQHRWERRRELRKLLGVIHRLATDDRQHGFEALDFFVGD